MCSPVRNLNLALAVSLLIAGAAAAQTPPARQQVIDTMKRATAFMVETVSHEGGYVWTYLPDRSRRWGEMEARPTMIWIQPPGTATMGHLFLDAYHATGDEYYYAAAEKVAGALMRAQHRSGGWNYMADFAGEQSLREWYDTVGKHGWRLEEFQKYSDTATFDDAGTAESSRFLLRMFAEKRDAKYKPALDRAIQFVLTSQYPNGGWPQRFPLQQDYSAYVTFNDDVAVENIDFLLLASHVLGDPRLRDPIGRAMQTFLDLQQPAPQAGWALQYTLDGQPAGARTYEPRALVTHTTASNIQALLRFHRLTGDAKYLARIPEALAWLESVALAPEVAAIAGGRTHPTFIEIGTNRPLYVHRTGSNAVNGRYYVDGDPRRTIGHYSAFRRIDLASLRTQYEEARARAAAVPGEVALPRFVTVPERTAAGEAAKLVASLNADGFWMAPLGYNTHPYKGPAPAVVTPGDFAQTHVGDVWDTSPFPDPSLMGISVDAYIRNMGVLIRTLEWTRDPAVPVVWRLDNLERIGGHTVTVIGAPRVVREPGGAAIEFNGVSDGLLVDANPLAGLARFTVEVVLQPASEGPEEQRFLHVQEAASENRALIELRLLPGARWALDSYLRSSHGARTLLDRERTQRAGEWHVATLTFDGTTMRHYVDGREDGRGDVVFPPLGPGQTSIGVRQNRVSWFKGRIREIRIYPEVRVPAVPLWPEGVPGARPDGGAERVVDGRVSNVHQPSLVYHAPRGLPTGTAVIVCPGGGYARLAIANEGAGVVERLTAAGVSVFVLKYRLAEYGHPAPLQDVLRAVRLVRSRAAQWGVAPDRIGVMGASAGGHVAASAAIWFDAPEGRTGAAIDAISARPDFVALLYPVITMRDPFAHDASRRNLLGASPAPALVARMSLDEHPRADAPPAFIVHTAEDRSVPLDHSVRFYQALRGAGVDAELHLFARGPHGFGTRADLGTTSGWTDRWIEWMRAHGWLAAPAVTWARGVEGQRRADLGNGFYLNPIVAGDRPDPSILKDGDDYYMTFSSFDAYPGLVIWHSRDLINWQPIGPALRTNVGSVWAPDLVKHNGRYYIYFPGVGPYRSNYVVWADDIRGPWSEPIDLKIGRIDPGHAVGPDGTRYLFLSAGYLVTLAPDGLSVVGAPRKVYDGWKYPEEWVVEGFAQEGPKILKRGGYYYMVLAEGGTAGPPTGHMIVAARSTSIEGPWENSPYNPILRTASASERWWSKGHGTLVEGPNGGWFVVYHAYENGFYNLGRQTLLEPIEWTADGWFKTTGVDPAQPIEKPTGARAAGPHGMPLSDDFATDRMGVQWSFYAGGAADRERYRYEDRSLVLKAKGTAPSDSSPLWFVTGDHAYEIEVEIDADAGATAGLLLFYNRRLYVGLGYSATNFIMHSYGIERPQAKPPHVGRRLHLRLRNDRHIVTIHYSVDGTAWERYDRGMEVSGYHHNVGYDFLSLRPALYAAGHGEVRFRNFRYRALP